MNNFKVLLSDPTDAIMDNIVNWLDDLHIQYEIEVVDVSDTSYTYDIIVEYSFTNEQDKLLFILKWK
jgi:hypothetical protein